jgi:hypothetical protein
VQALLDDGRVDADGASVYADCLLRSGRVTATEALALGPVRRALERWLRWRQRRPWLRAGQ